MLSVVNWAYLALMVAVFVAALVGSYVSCKHRIVTAVATALVITAMFVFASYFPQSTAIP